MTCDTGQSMQELLSKHGFRISLKSDRLHMFDQFGRSMIICADEFVAFNGRSMQEASGLGEYDLPPANTLW